MAHSMGFVFLSESIAKVKKQGQRMSSRGVMLVRRAMEDEVGVRYLAPEDDDQLADAMSSTLLHPMDKHWGEMEEEMGHCQEELASLQETLAQLGMLAPVDVAMEAEEDEVDGTGVEEDEEAKERRQVFDHVRTANAEDLEHGRAARIGQVFLAGELGGWEEEVVVWQGGRCRGNIAARLAVCPESEVSIIGEEQLELLGLGSQVVECLDSVKGLEVLGQVEVQVEVTEERLEVRGSQEAPEVQVRLLVVAGVRRAALSWWVSALLLA